ncbi:hypothetical protein C8N46_10574 [Kordia periserrulae]|uniref:Uncharacterized protein n=1 Tax=Kordia periserrulae TaxID=701523 RepID=A0A2T6BXY0_9FLAO|nr:hypothetical protein [Kordia periserrulae]PTX60918.1 hypothetical protein C8N46_10574 [Kordia periserrulae]
MIEILRTKLIQLLLKKYKKRKPKPWTRKDTFFAILTVAITFFLIFLMAKWIKNYEKEQLENSFFTIACIEKLKPRASKTRGFEDRILFFFIKNDTVLHKVYTTYSGTIDKHNINEGDCFELKVAEKDYDVYECYFNKKIDTIISKKKYENHTYHTIFHKMKLE